MTQQNIIQKDIASFNGTLFDFYIQKDVQNVM